MNQSTTRTTFTLPTELLEATDQIVHQGKAKSRNEFVAKAIKNEIDAFKRTQIDAELAQMAQDPEYQALVLQMDAEFALASWEALQLGEQEE